MVSNQTFFQTEKLLKYLGYPPNNSSAPSPDKTL